VAEEIKRGRGRPRGSKSKAKQRFGESAIESFQCAFSNLGGTKGLTDWGRKNKTEFYRIFAKRLPAAVELDAQVNGSVTVEVVQFTTGSAADPTPEPQPESK
jgi:hypothetical protein